MFYLKKKNIEKSFLSNLNCFQNIKGSYLSFKDQIPLNLILGSSALFILTGKKPTILFKKISKKRKSRVESIGSKVFLNKKESMVFFFYLVLFIFPNLENFKGFYVSKVFGSSITFNFSNLLIFPELEKELDKFYGLKNLNFTLNFNSLSDMSFFFNLYNFPINNHDTTRN